MSILITGESGKLGMELQKVFNKAIFPTQKQLDITRESDVTKNLKTINPKILIHAAAVTDIRWCEKNKRQSWSTNVEGTKNLARASLTLKPQPYFIFISTACVFHGDSSFYTEEDIPYPKNFYSLTKLIGEIIVKRSGLKNWLIIRTNFVPKAPWPYPRAFTDRFGTYLYANDVAQAIKELIDNKVTGIIHVCGDKKMSMYELAKMVSPKVKPTTLKEYKGPPLTIDMSLSTKKWKKYKISAP